MEDLGRPDDPWMGWASMKTRLKRWMVAAGCWSEFVRERQARQREGLGGKESWLAALGVVVPEDVLATFGLRRLEDGSWEASVVEGRAAKAGDLEKAGKSPAVRAAGREDGEGLPAVEEGEGASVSDWSEEVVGDRGVATPATAVRWVAKMIRVKDVTPEMSPSPEAWGLLCWARRSALNESEFYKSLYRQLLPTRAQLENEEKVYDDGDAAMRAIDALISDDGHFGSID